MPNRPGVFGIFILNSGIALSGIIFSLGNFLFLATCAKLTSVSKSGTIAAFIQSAHAAKTARSYCLFQESISYTKPRTPNFFASPFN